MYASINQLKSIYYISALLLVILNALGVQESRTLFGENGEADKTSWRESYFLYL